MKSLTQFIAESLSKVSVDSIKDFISMEKDLGFKIDGTDLDKIVDVFISYHNIDDVCNVLKISTTAKDTEFSKKQKIKTEFKKLAK